MELIEASNLTVCIIEAVRKHLAALNRDPSSVVWMKSGVGEYNSHIPTPEVKAASYLEYTWMENEVWKKNPIGPRHVTHTSVLIAASDIVGLGVQHIGIQINAQTTTTARTPFALLRKQFVLRKPAARHKEFAKNFAYALADYFISADGYFDEKGRPLSTASSELEERFIPKFSRKVKSK